MQSVLVPHHSLEAGVEGSERRKMVLTAPIAWASGVR